MRRFSIESAATLVLACLVCGTPAQAGSAADTALRHVQRQSHVLGLAASDVHEVVVSSEVRSAATGVTHVYLQQLYRGIEVHNGVLTVNVDADQRVLSTADRFVARIATVAGSQTAQTTAAEAVEAAAAQLALEPTEPFEVLEQRGGASDETVLSGGGVSADPIGAKLVWLPVEGGVRLAWSVAIDEASGNHWWTAFVDAETGDWLGAYDLVVHDSAEAIAAAITRPAPAAPRAAKMALPSFADLDGASYNVFPVPFESPNDGGRSLIVGAAAPTASPLGWHDTNGVAGPEFTVTRGNNAHAYTDIDANNVADPGSSPDGGAGLDFDFPLSLALDPPTYRPAAVANLFYWNNIVHDVTFGYGFDEAAGNFQVFNHSGAVGGNDDVRAEAQDGSGTNNANFATPSQAAVVPRPRMQMFVWTHPTPNLVTVNDGPSAGSYTASRATFGPQLSAIPPVTGAVVLVDDGIIGPPVPPATVPGTLNDGCEPYTLPLGSIALLERGLCTFTVKVFNAQNAGAAGVIVTNNVAGAPITMGATPPIPPIVIPAVMVTLADGDLFEANLPFGATLSADPVLAVNRDSDLDAGVIAHEYGHGISNRLTGGPNIVNCLQNAEQMGEGWSDWFALVLTTHPADTKLTARGVGPYLIFEPGDGGGIRPTAYTTDMTVNPSTYASVANVAAISQPHGIGYVWNTMLWEMYWNLVDRYGYNADIYGDWSTGGNNLAIQLVMDGMKFQVCSPGFVDGRNAILQADTALTGGVVQCEIWRAFAKRGLGTSASQGLSTNRLDGVQAFDLPASCTTAVFGGFKPPIDAAPAINSRNAGSTVPVKYSVTGAPNPLQLDSQPVDCTTLLPTGEAPTPVTLPGTNGPSKNNQYHVNWRTDPAWEGTCRRLTLRIPAASDAVAYFSFH